MQSDVEIERALAVISATVNDHGMDEYDRVRVQSIVDTACDEPLRADDAGGIHQASGERIGALRRTSSGEWIIERQNEKAEGSEAEIPGVPED